MPSLRPFRYFKTIPEIIRLAVMMYVLTCPPEGKRDADPLLPLLI